MRQLETCRACFTTCALECGTWKHACLTSCALECSHACIVVNWSVYDEESNEFATGVTFYAGMFVSFAPTFWTPFHHSKPLRQRLGVAKRWCGPTTLPNVCPPDDGKKICTNRRTVVCVNLAHHVVRPSRMRARARGSNRCANTVAS